MALALYDKIAPIEQSYLLNFCNERYLEKYLATRDWGERVAWTSNELQNLGVMLQYARDYQEMTVADGILLRIYEEIQKRQDKKTGLFGQSFQTPWEISLGVQSGYHFWLLMHYDNFPLQNVEKIIDNLLSSQNILGGYSINWNSSACEDIDSIDPLYRLSRLTNYRNDEIQKSLKRALPQILVNLNIDGGWVFKRNEELKVVHSEMYSGVNESNIFFTWFRILGLAYCLLGMKEVPKGYTYNWQFKRAPGQQFL
jgi:hypothetical protein